jgi:hypothetical protein
LRQTRPQTEIASVCGPKVCGRRPANGSGAYAWLELVARQFEPINTVCLWPMTGAREAIRSSATSGAGRACWSPSTATHGRRSGSIRGRAPDALRALPAPAASKRTILTLQIAGYSYREIGDQLHMTPRTVERQILRARTAMREPVAVDA